jgi:hypothetical protein
VSGVESVECGDRDHLDVLNEVERELRAALSEYDDEAITLTVLDVIERVRRRTLESTRVHRAKRAEEESSSDRPRIGDRVEIAAAPPGAVLRTFDPGWVPAVVTELTKTGFLARDTEGKDWSRDWGSDDDRWRWTC